MLIGIAGKMNSGKDTVATIIQYLTTNTIHSYNYLDFINPEINGLDDLTNLGSDWEIHRFADKIKDIVCILLNCTREQLEDRIFKETPLGEDWIRYGYADGFFQSNGKTIMNNKSCSKERYEEELKINWETAYKIEYTPRMLFQLIGTEVGREMLHYDIWVNSLMKQYDVVNNISVSTKWLIPDVRFENEYAAIKKRNGIIINIIRPCTTCGVYINQFCSDAYHSPKHKSETYLENYHFDYIIYNSGNIEYLIEQVKEIIIKENIK